MPRLSRRTQQVLATLATVVVLLLVWLVQSQSSGSEQEDGGRAGEESSSAAAPSSDSDDSGESGGSGERDGDGIAYVELDSLPPEAAETVELIDAGGPFPHEGKDGSTFGNFEGVLPDRPRGYYAEYTVPTPGVSHRGARRIVAGDGGELYWTEDHYESFERIRR